MVKYMGMTCADAESRNGKCMGLPVHSCRYCPSYINQETPDYEEYDDCGDDDRGEEDDE